MHPESNTQKILRSVFLIALVTKLLLGAGSAQAQGPTNLDLYVSPTGSTGQDCGMTPEVPCRFIQSALDIAAQNQEIPTTVHLAPGTYGPDQLQGSNPYESTVQMGYIANQ